MTPTEEPIKPTGEASGDPMALWGAWPGDEPIEKLMAGLDEQLNKPMNEQNWRSIESAPKDGTRILVPMRGRVTLAQWDSQPYNTRPRPFWKSIDPFGVHSDRANQPAYWMPLPSLPEVKSNETESTK